jgi:sucrose phosphorylase
LLEKKLWAADNGGSAGHKEINRTTLLRDIEQGLKTDIVKPAKDNSSKKYLRCILGKVEINDAYDDVIDLKWVNNKTVAHLKANLKTYTFYNRYRKKLHKMSF